jgi:DedD protein
MRDLERWKDKVEISLDGRQIFFLFFGSAVAACLIFVLGVLIGKRLEARALAMTPAPVEDPLAALDQLGEADEADEGLTFHKALTKEGIAAVKRAEKPVADKPPVEKIEAAKPVIVEAAKLPAPPPVVVPRPESPALAAKAQVDPAPAADAPKVVAQKPTAQPPRALPPGKPLVVQKKPDATASHFTLQLSAFPDKSDAEEFMHKIQAAGYKPFLVASEVPGKGVFFRVRVGDYATRQSAVDAKGEFERKQRMIAYVAKL